MPSLERSENSVGMACPPLYFQGLEISYNPHLQRYYFRHNGQTLSNHQHYELVRSIPGLARTRENLLDIGMASQPPQPPQPPQPIQPTNWINQYQSIQIDPRFYYTEIPVEAPLRAATLAIDDEISRALFNIDPSDMDQTTPPPPPRHKWPIGTILRFNIDIPGVKDHLMEQIKTLSYPLVKVNNYTMDGQTIKNITWIGSAEKENCGYEIKYFTEASQEECDEYNKRYEALNICSELPSIGVVLRYVGRKESINNHRAVVMAHRKNKVNIIFLNKKLSGYDDFYDYDLFSISNNQQGCFTPDLVNNYCTCAECSSVILKNTALNIEIDQHGTNIKFCNNECAEGKGYCKCAFCRKWALGSDFSSTYDGSVCDFCFRNNYNECDECDNYYRNSRMRTNSDMTHTCQSCCDNGSPVIHDYSYKPRPIYQKMMWENTRYFGFELEIETNTGDYKRILSERIKTWLSEHKTEDYKELINGIPTGKIIKGKRLDKLVYLKNDGSLTYGIEIVSHPFTLKAFHKRFPAREFLKFITESGGIVNDRCGMHVHVSKDKLSEQELLKGKWFFYKCEKYIKKFSQRNIFNYCTFECDKPSKNPYDQPSGRRTALNVAGSPKTLEIRVYASTLDYDKFLANLQFSDAFVAYIQVTGPSFLMRSTPVQVWENFVDYAKQTRQYQVLTNYILRNAIV